MTNIQKVYDSNADVKEYIDRYAESRGIPVEVAFTHAMVRIYVSSMK